MLKRTDSSRHIIYSKYAEERYVSIINEETLIIKAHDLHATSIGFGNSIGNSYKTIEFTGGPNIQVNTIINLKRMKFKIKSIFEKSAPIEWKWFLVKGEFIK